MSVFVNSFFEKRVEQLFDLAQRVETAFASAGLEYRYTTYPGENHNSVRLSSFPKALYWVYR